MQICFSLRQIRRGYLISKKSGFLRDPGIFENQPTKMLPFYGVVRILFHKFRMVAKNKIIVFLNCHLVMVVFVAASLLKRFELQGQIPHFKEKIPAKSSFDPATLSYLCMKLPSEGINFITSAQV